MGNIIKYFSMFSGIGGFEHGIQKAENYLNGGQDKSNLSQYATEGSRQTEFKNIESRGERSLDEGGRSVLLSRHGELYGSRGESRGENIDRDGQIRFENIGYCEIDKYAESIYRKHYGRHRNYGDATRIGSGDLPDFDLLVGGFPCQAFSIAGKRRGFEEARGTLFFDVARILADKRPRCVLLENVKGLLTHESGKTFQHIIKILADIGYVLQWEVLNSKHFSVPQNRERVFIVGYYGDRSFRKVLPIGDCFGETERENKENSSKIIGNIYPSNSENGDFLDICGISKTLKLGTTDNKNGAIGLSNSPKVIVEAFPMTEARTDEAKAVRREMMKNGKDWTPRKQKKLIEKTDGQVGALTANFSREQLIKINKTKYGEHHQDAVFESENSISPSLMLGGDGNIGESCAGYLKFKHHTRIRRLTPRECERLQAFPDDWTQFGMDKEGNQVEISDTQRYKTLGNSVTTTVVSEVVKRMYRKT